jgi:hypothetical protein
MQLSPPNFFETIHLQVWGAAQWWSVLSMPKILGLISRTKTKNIIHIYKLIVS